MSLLRQALKDSPNNALAHWQLGDLLVSGVWQSAAELERAAQKDQRLAEYCPPARRSRSKREQPKQPWLAGAGRIVSTTNNECTGRSCCSSNQDNVEAIQSLGLRPYRGMMLTLSQIEQLKSQQQSVVKATVEWRPLVAQWRRAAEGHDATIPPELRKRIVEIADAAEMVALEGELWRQVAAKRQTQLYHDMTLALMPLLGDNRRPAAAESLARYAAFSSFKDVQRTAACRGIETASPRSLRAVTDFRAAIADRSQHAVHVKCNRRPDCTHYTFFQEGALVNVSSTLMLSPAYSGLELAPSAQVTVAPGTGTVQFERPQDKQRLLQTDPGRVAAAYAQARANAASLPRTADVNAANEVAVAENWIQNARNSRKQGRSQRGRPCAMPSIEPTARSPSANAQNHGRPLFGPRAWIWGINRFSGGPGGGRTTTKCTTSAESPACPPNLKITTKNDRNIVAVPRRVCRQPPSVRAR